MIVQLRGRALAAALLVTALAARAEAQPGPIAPLPPEPVVPTHLPDLPLTEPISLPGAEALDRLISPTLVPLPDAGSSIWFADPLAMPLSDCEPCAGAAGIAGAAFGGPLGSRPYLLGDWGGVRSRLANRGITFDLYSTNFFNDIANGGLRETATYRGRMDYLAHIDGAKAGLWQGFFVDLHAESIYGDSINSRTGTLLPVSIAQAVPVPNGYVTALTGVKFTQALSERFIVYGGKINALDEFNQPFTGGSRGVNGFMNTAFTFNPILTRTVPYSAYAFGAAYLKNLQPVLALTVFDALSTPTVSGFDTFFDNGVVLVPQINLPTNFFGLPGHQGIMGAWSSRKYASTDRSAYLSVLQGAPVSSTRTDGAWSLAYSFDQTAFVSPCDPKRSWGVFGNLGIADANPSPIGWFASIGIGGSSPIESRKLDTFGLGYFYLGLNDSFRNIAPARFPLRDEQGVELFYNVGVTPWCHITPDIQFIVPAQRNADALIYFGLRAKVDF